MSVLVGVVVFANDAYAVNTKSKVSGSVASSTIASSTIKRAVKLDQTTARLQTRADKEIDRRITGLNKLQEKIQGMKKVSDTEKAGFATTIQGQINLLNNLKVKINADIDAATIKTDVQSITKAYRIYALILPQVEIFAAADRLATTVDLLLDYADKLQTRITAAQDAGKDVSALQSLLADMKNKIAEASVKSASATIGIVGLKPDNGDKTVMESNLKALKTAKNDIKVGTQDIKDANKLGLKIRTGLKASEKPTATSTATTTLE